MLKPLGPTFHRSFPLQRSTVARYLTATADAGTALDAAEARRRTKLGSMKVPAALGYCRATGLLDETGNLTDLGKVVYDSDSELTALQTHWLLHIGLCGLSPMAPKYWESLWEAVGVGAIVQRRYLDRKVQESYPAGYISEDSSKVSATAFVSTYTQEECLGSLSILERTSKDGVRGTTSLQTPNVATFTFALASRWESMHPRQLTTTLDTFIDNSGLAAMFRISKDAVLDLLSRSARSGAIELYQSAPPHQVVRKWSDISEITRGLYADL